MRRPSGSVGALPHTGLRPKAPVRPHPGAAPEWRPVPLPAGLAFLTAYGVSPAPLLLAAAEARRQAIAPEAALLASGSIGDSFYYRCLAHRLGAAFIDGEVALGDGARYPHAIHVGFAPIDGDAGPGWLAAPRGRLLAHLLARRLGGERLARGRSGERWGGRLAITTPSHLSRLVRAAATASILREANLGLANLDPSLSAKAGPSQAQCAFAMTAIAVSTFAFGLAPAFTLAVVSLSMSCFFLASIWLRLFAGAASTASGLEPFRARVEDRLLPVYSVVAALHREARIVPQLAAALDAIDYPRGKLDIKLVVEHGDRATRLAIEALHLPANYEIVVAPAGWPRTKPRALNIALPLARGELLVIFDAEDAPAPGQLREAAERFLRAPRKLACLQARLAIDNIEDSWLTRLFAIEYAVLFDVLNPG
ncbi:MAG: glycosyltransferase, partial [Methylocella sp.]